MENDVLKNLNSIADNIGAFTSSISALAEKHMKELPEDQQQEFKKKMSDANMQSKEVQNQLKNIMSNFDKLQSNL